MVRCKEFIKLISDNIKYVMLVREALLEHGFYVEPPYIVIRLSLPVHACL